MAEVKVCSRCGIEKALSEFHVRKDRKCGVQPHCKDCQKLRKSGYLATENGKVISHKNSKQYYHTHREKALSDNKKWREEHKEERRSYNKIYETGRVEIKRNWKKANRETINLYAKQKYKNDSNYRLNSLMRTSLKRSLKGSKNGNHWENLVGYTLGDLIRRLKSTIPDGYKWSDYVNGARLHIDHIVPIAVHNFSTPNDIDFKRCWALSNLRLLTAHENLSKNAKIDHPFQPSFMF